MDPFPFGCIQWLHPNSSREDICQKEGLGRSWRPQLVLVRPLANHPQAWNKTSFRPSAVSLCECSYWDMHDLFFETNIGLVSCMLFSTVTKFLCLPSQIGSCGDMGPNVPFFPVTDWYCKHSLRWSWNKQGYVMYIYIYSSVIYIWYTHQTCLSTYRSESELRTLMVQNADVLVCTMTGRCPPFRTQRPRSLTFSPGIRGAMGWLDRWTVSDSSGNRKRCWFPPPKGRYYWILVIDTTPFGWIRIKHIQYIYL